MCFRPAEPAKSAGIAAYRRVQTPDKVVNGESDNDTSGGEGVAVETPYLGVSGSDVDSGLVGGERLPVAEGVYVREVRLGTRAELAGIRAGDVIIGLDEAEIRSMHDLSLAVSQHSVGDSITVALYREGSSITISMIVGAR